MTQIQDRPDAKLTGTADQLGLTQSTALVMGSIIGVGTFSLPYAIASYGPISLMAMAIATVAAIALAMICAEMPLAAAKDGLFPSRFGRLSARQVPAFGIIASTILASLAVILSYLGTSGASVFTTLVLMTGITSAIPYAFSALAQIKWRWHDHQRGHTPRLFLDLSVAAIALLLSLAFIYYSRNTGNSWYVVWGPFLMASGASLIGVPVYLSMRDSMTEPDPVPEYR